MGNGTLRFLAKMTLVLASLVVLAGSVVRMTGSGMGCPDWPKCFGLLIPPTHVDQVTWHEGRDYRADQMVLADGVFYQAVAAHHSGGDWVVDRDKRLWTAYTAHDYTHFNPVHTWVEYVNRLLGALSGVPALLLFGSALVLAMRRRKWRPVAWASVVLVLFATVAWLGKKVVDGNLIPFSITIHMVGALAILLALTYFLIRVTPRADRADAKDQSMQIPSRLHWFLWASIALATVQLVSGTQVRESVDLLASSGLNRELWINSLPDWWEFHRSGAWLVAAVHVMWAFPARKWGRPYNRLARWVLALLAIQATTGILFSYFAMPAWAQPIHLMAGMAVVVMDAAVIWFLKPALKS